MKPIRQSPEALRDVDEIWYYIAKDNEGAATRLVDRIYRATERLIDFPLSGTTRRELGRDIQSVAVGSYTLFYRVELTEVLILRVVHSARDISNLFATDDADDPNA